MPPRMVINITRKRSRKFHFDLARFFRAALAPSLPRAVRVFLGRRAIVFLRRAALVAFLMFPLRSGLLFSSHKFTQPDLRGRIFCSPRATLNLSGDAFVCALLSSRQPSGNVQSVASPRALRVSTMPALRRRDGSRALSARFVARDRFGEGFLRRPARPFARSRFAWRFVRCVPRFGGGNFTPARRALDRPMAIACSGDRAPCLPSRMCSISSRTNSPA